MLSYPTDFDSQGFKHRVLFGTLYGSSLYGTSTPTSDRDEKWVYLPSLDRLMLGHGIETIERKTNKGGLGVRNTMDDVDRSFIPVQTLARDFYKGQTYALELVFGVNGDHAEQTTFEPSFLDFAQELRNRFTSSHVKPMVGYVVNQASLYSFKGERVKMLDSLIPAFEELIKQHGQETKQSKVSGALELFTTAFPKYVRRDLYEVGAGNTAPALFVLEKTLPDSNQLRQSLAVLKALRDKYGGRAKEASVDSVDWKATMHATRIANQAIEYLATGRIELPVSTETREYYLAMKRGELDYERVKAELDAKLELVKELEQTTKLPPPSLERREELESFILDYVTKLYAR